MINFAGMAEWLCSCLLNRDRKINVGSIPTACTLYYRSFDAFKYPIRPTGQIELSEAMSLVTYYEAKYDDKGRLIKFIKHIQSGSIWVIAFEVDYEYHKSGKFPKKLNMAR
jgi:hypothetical protein